MKIYTVHICAECGEQQWFAGTCPSCGRGRVRTYPALLLKDIESFSAEVCSNSSPVPALWLQSFMAWLLARLQRSSG